MSPDLHILQHSLGVDEFGRGRQYRNHFCTGEGSDDYPTCMDLVARGLMVRRDGSELTGGDYWFVVTSDGKRWMADNSPTPPKLTRSQQRYRDYIEADSSGSFRDWITRKPRTEEFEEIPF